MLVGSPACDCVGGIGHFEQLQLKLRIQHESGKLDSGWRLLLAAVLETYVLSVVYGYLRCIQHPHIYLGYFSAARQTVQTCHMSSSLRPTVATSPGDRH